GKRAVRCHSRSLNGRRWSRQPLYADLMEWGTAGLHGSEQVADINRNARPTSSALWVRMKSIVSIQPATNARTVLGSVSIRRFDVRPDGVPGSAARAEAQGSRVLKYLKRSCVRPVHAVRNGLLALMGSANRGLITRAGSMSR